MRIFRYTYLLGLLVLLLGSCQKDEFSQEEQNIIDLPTEYLESHAYGLVADVAGVALANVEVTLGDQVVTTDERGYFKVGFQRAASTGATLIFNKSGYFKNYKTFLPENGNENFVRVIMTTEKEIGQVESSTGGGVETEEGASILFQSEGFVDKNGNSYSGTVTVLAHWYDPSAELLPETMPGDLRGSDTTEQRVQLATYGMMAVELRGTDGEELQLAEGKPATIDFPLPQELASSAPATIQTWSLDENSGYWVEEGMAELTNGVYRAEVSHFSFWNCDIPFRPIGKLKGVLVNENGIPLKGYKVCVTLLENSMTAYAWTDEIGFFSGIVPAETLLRMSVKNECGAVIYSDEFTVDGDFLDLGIITVIETGDELLVNGNLICEGIPVTNGYAWILTKTGQTYVANVDQDGNFEILLSRCGTDKITVQGVNLENGTVSEELILDDLDKEVTIDNLEVCNELDEYIIYKINGEERLITAPDLRIVNGEIKASGRVDFEDSGINFSIPDAMVGANYTDFMNCDIFDNNVSLSAFCRDQECENIEVNITSLGGVGGVVIGEFMGTIIDLAAGSVQVMGEFRIYVDSDTDENEISGIVFLDQDDNNIAQYSENRSAANLDIQINLLDANSLDQVATTPIVMIGDWFGYRFEDITPGEYIIQAILPTGFDFVDRDQGTDEFLDSDVDPSTGQSETITIDSRSVIRELGIGIKQSLTDLNCNLRYDYYPGCDSPTGAVYISVTNWDSIQYTLNVTGPVNHTDQSNFGGFDVEELLPGTYNYIVTASNGASCEDTFILEEMTELDCPLSYELLVCEGEFPRYEIIPSCQLGANATYQWIGPTGLQGTGSVIFETPPGIHSITITDVNGCSSEQDLNIEFFGAGLIYGEVWEDLENFELDVQEKNLEDLVSGINVSLYMVGDTLNPVRTVATGNGPDDFGSYVFDRIPFGNYFIGFELPTGFEFVEKESPQSPDRWSDSNVNPESGFSDTFDIIDGCEQYDYIDAGIKQY